MRFQENYKLIPRKIYWIGSLSILAAFLTAGAMYGVAMMLQVFTVLLGFVELNQISPILQPLGDSATLFFGCFTVVVVIQGVGQFLQNYINIAFAETFNYEVRKVFLETLFRPGSNWNYDLGTTSNILAEVIPKSASFVTSFARFLILLLQVVILGVFCVITLPKAFLYSTVIFSVIMPFIFYLNRKSKTYGAQILARSETLNRQLMRSVKNFLFLKILGIEQVEKKRTVDHARSYYEQFMKTSFYYSLANSLPITFATLIVVFLFYYFSTQGATTPSLLTLFYLLYRFAGTMSQAVAITNGLSMHKPNFDAVMNVLKDVRKLETAQALPAAQSKCVPQGYLLKAENIAFSYSMDSKDNYVFEKLNINLPEHQILGVKGPSGSGKTTLLMTLIGVLAHSSGKVQWGGSNLDELDPSSFRANIGYMGPEPFIISGTARDNLIYGLYNQPSMESLWAACREAEAESFLKSMKNGLDTPLSEQGEGLSMGQKQRLGLARALLRRPKILILDEITANLDGNTETAIIRNIANMKSRMTILVSTHSNAFDVIADQVLELGTPPRYREKPHVAVG